MDRPLELLQFLGSPYNEKVRWALDLKRVAHRRRALLPGPHVAATLRLTGQTATPVLRAGTETLHGSARILDWIEARYPDPPIEPGNAAARERAREIERRFDRDLTPRMRRALLAAMLTDAGYFTGVFGGAHGPGARRAYRAALPLVKPLVRAGNGIKGQASIDDSKRAIAEAMDLVARAIGPGGYLIGDRFTRADLAAAAHLAIIVEPDHPDTSRPRPRPAAVEALLAPWVEHPAAAWAREMYRRHRPGAVG